MVWKILSFPPSFPTRLPLLRVEAELADVRSHLVCQALRPQLKADKSAWILRLSEAVSEAPPQHQWSALRSLWAAIDPVQ
eukprot:11088833-Prorocentrum_lima.AAC.1